VQLSAYAKGIAQDEESPLVKQQLEDAANTLAAKSESIINAANKY
jgi:hypothetical protein